MNMKEILDIEQSKVSARLFFIIILSFAYSTATTIGPMVINQNIEFSITSLLTFVLCLIVSLLLNIVLLGVIPSLHIFKRECRAWNFLDSINDRNFFLLTWVLLVVSWIPAFLTLYPGVLSYDIISQTNSAFGEITNNHHPILHTWLIRVFLQFGNRFFSSYEVGLGFMSLVQMILLSYALAKLVTLLKKENVPSIFVLLTGVLSGLWFVNAILSVTFIKDTLHAAFLVLFACHFTEIVMDTKQYLSQKRNLVLLPVVSFLMCALRNNGIHIYLFCFCLLALLNIKNIKKIKTYIPLILVILIPIVSFKIYTGPIFKALEIEPGAKKEALCIPIQQMQRVAILEEEQLSVEDKTTLNYHITDLSWMTWDVQRYDPFFADYAKDCFVSSRYEENSLSFWKFYLQLGLHYPKDYIMGFLSNTLGFWYPGYYRFSYVMYDNYSPDSFLVPLERKSLWNALPIASYYESMCSSETWRKIPVVRMFFVPGFSVWFLLYGLAFAWRKKGFFTKVFPVFLPIIAQYGIMLLSPMSSFRYSWPFYLLLPLVLVGILGVKTGEHSESSHKI